MILLNTNTHTEVNFISLCSFSFFHSLVKSKVPQSSSCNVDFNPIPSQPCISITDRSLGVHIRTNSSRDEHSLLPTSCDWDLLLKRVFRLVSRMLCSCPFLRLDFWGSFVDFSLDANLTAMSKNQEDCTASSKSHSL